MNALKMGIAAVALAVSAPAAMAATTSFSFACFTNNTGSCSSYASQLQMDVTEVGANQVSFTFLNLNPVQGSITEIYFDTNNGAARLANPVIVAQPVTGNFQDDGANGFPPGSNGNPWQWGGTTDFSFIPTPPTSPNGVQSGESLTIGFDLLVSYADLINSFTNPPLGATRVGLHLQSIGANDNFSEGMYATVVPIPGALPLMLGGLLGLGVLARRRIGT